MSPKYALTGVQSKSLAGFWTLKSKLSHETIYKHIWADKQAGGDLYKHLRRQGKKYDKRRNGKSARGQIKVRVSIDKRPRIVEYKKRIGDWEIDTVIGKGHSGALVTVMERVSNFTLAAHVNSKIAKEVTKATIALLTPLKDRVHTITADNDKEFAYHEQISESLKKSLLCSPLQLLGTRAKREYERLTAPVFSKKYQPEKRF